MQHEAFAHLASTLRAVEEEEDLTVFRWFMVDLEDKGDKH